MGLVTLASLKQRVSLQGDLFQERSFRGQLGVRLRERGGIRLLHRRTFSAKAGHFDGNRPGNGVRLLAPSSFNLHSSYAIGQIALDFGQFGSERCLVSKQLLHLTFEAQGALLGLRSGSIGAIPLDEAGLIRVLDALPVRPVLAGEKGLRLSLAGAQSKVPVVLVDGAVALPAPGQPTTHILKPPIARLSGTTENEALVMRLAAVVGLDVAAVEPRVVQDRTFLLVERYDRFRGEDALQFPWATGAASQK